MLAKGWLILVMSGGAVRGRGDKKMRRQEHMAMREGCGDGRCGGEKTVAKLFYEGLQRTGSLVDLWVAARHIKYSVVHFGVRANGFPPPGRQRCYIYTRHRRWQK